MEDRTISTSTPPRMMNAIVAGFNVVATHLALLILPILIDIGLWLGPQISVEKLIKPMVDSSVRLFQQLNAPELTSQLKAVNDLWTHALASFNLAGVIQTLPIGVPSLMASVRSTATPIGSARIIEVPSLTSAFLIWVVILAIGFVAGSMYFCMLARATSTGPTVFEFKTFVIKTGLSVGLTIGLLLAIIFLAVPVLMLVSVISLISPGLGDFTFLLAGFILIWMLLPLIFTPHAVYTLKTSLIGAVMTSIRLVRHFLPGTGIFLIIVLVIAKGMDVLWRIPPANSWMTLVGILGHAFIYTAVLAASFVYFRGGLRWMAERTLSAQPQGIKS